MHAMSTAIENYVKLKAGIERRLASGANNDGSQLSAEDIAKWKQALATVERAIEVLRS
jgi:hypothetical protein